MDHVEESAVGADMASLVAAPPPLRRPPPARQPRQLRQPDRPDRLRHGSNVVTVMDAPTATTELRQYPRQFMSYCHTDRAPTELRQRLRQLRPTAPTDSSDRQPGLKADELRGLGRLGYTTAARRCSSLPRALSRC